MVMAAAVLLLQLAPALQVPPTVPAAQSAKPVTVQANAGQNDAGKLLVSADVPAMGSATTIGTPASGNSQPAPSGTTANSSGSSSASQPAVAVNSAEQNALSTIRLPQPPLAKPEPISAVELPSRRSWLLLSLAEHGAAAFDAYATREAVSRGAVEENPLLRPFAHSDGLYGAIQICPVLLDFASRKMQRSENNFLRRTWWVPQSVSSAVYLFSGVHDLHVANER